LISGFVVGVIAHEFIGCSRFFTDKLLLFFLCVWRACMRAAGCATMRKCGTCQSATGVQQRVSAD